MIKEIFSCGDADAGSKAEARDALQVLVDLTGEIFEDGFLKLESFEPHGTKNSKTPGSVTLIKEEKEESKGKEGKAGNEDPAPPLRNPLVQEAQEDDESVEHAIQEGAALGETIKEFGKSGGYEEADVMLLHPTTTHAQGLTDGLAGAGISCGLIDKAARMDSLECQDILALLHAIFDPSYGLMVAQVLRSPIFNVPEEDLWKVFQAGDRKTHCDWVEGLENAKGGKELTEAQSKLSSWREAYQEQKLPAHELLALCYKKANIINKYVAKVPPAMAKRVVLNLEWVLNYSLEALGGKLALPSEYAEHLQKLREASEDISSSMEQEKAVRSLTIHGAKGMEGRLVAIGNSNYPKRSKGPQMLLSWNVDALEEGPAHISFLRSKKEASQSQKLALRQLEAEAAQERCNLLYVAMTRAQEHLIFSVKPMKETANSPKVGWGNKVSDSSLLQKGARVHRYGDHTAKRVAEEEENDEQLVCWGEKPGKPSIDTEKKDALSEESIRGTQLHNLLALELQSSTDENGVLQLDLLDKRLDPADEKTWSMQRRLLGIGKKLQEKLAGQIKTILTNEKENPNYFGFLIAQEPFIECELPAVDNDGESRRIDCLLTTKEGVIWILDFKTGNTEEHEEDHNKQLRGYREIVKKNYPDKDDDDIKIAIVDKEGALREVTP
ncbi:MAG: PD-(D/E)XK nuclease family protein [Gammaproteobacteria bacterium AqS3]|nr:PD-(D/E)XK nuclease family protein [Gammaproteobacteria bacterium AqS3]